MDPVGVGSNPGIMAEDTGDVGLRYSSSSVEASDEEEMQTPSQGSEYADSSYSSDNDDGMDRSTSRVTNHTVMFKVIGCTKEDAYSRTEKGQDTLLRARDLLESGIDVCVELVPEPTNPKDAKAIAFMCTFEDKKRYRIGYVVKEILNEVHSALNNNEVTSVKFGWIKYVSDWTRSGPGFFAGVKVTKIGHWEPCVIRAASTRLM